MPNPPIRKQNFKISPKIPGAFAFSLAVYMGIHFKCPNEVQCFVIYLLTGLGFPLLFAKSAEKSRLKISVKHFEFYFAGEIALVVFLIWLRPIQGSKGDSCHIYFTTVTVAVSAKEGNHNVTLPDKGDVVMYIIGKAKIRSHLDGDGQALFQDLMIGDSVRLDFNFSEPYKPMRPDSIYVIKANENIDLTVSLEGLGLVTGNVDYNNMPLAGVNVQLEAGKRNLDTVTDNKGNFTFSVPLEMQQKAYAIVLTQKGFKLKQDSIYPQVKESLHIPMEKQ